MGEKEELLMCLCLFVRGIESSECVCSCVCVCGMYPSVCLRVCVYEERKLKRSQRAQDTLPIDILLTSAPGTMRLSADEIQINCKAVR